MLSAAAYRYVREHDSSFIDIIFPYGARVDLRVSSATSGGRYNRYMEFKSFIKCQNYTFG